MPEEKAARGRAPAQTQDGHPRMQGPLACCVLGDERNSCSAGRTVAPPVGVEEHTAGTERVGTRFPSGRRGSR